MMEINNNMSTQPQAQQIKKTEVAKAVSYAKPRCMTPKDVYTFDYPQILKLELDQLENFWLPGEPKVEKDKHSILTEMDEEERHGIITTLRLFTLYELIIGLEYWGGRFKRMFPRPDFIRMATAFGFTELCIHAPFYNEINEVLGLANDDFYTSYTKDPILKERMDFLDELVSRKGSLVDDLISVGGFSMIEGAVLYSSFAYLKSFQMNGKNKIGAIVSGVSFSTRDEHLHSLGGAISFRIAMEESIKDGLLTNDQVKHIHETLREMGRKTAEHEFRIIDMIYEKGDKGNQKESLKQFVMSRVNLCLNNLGIPSIFSYDDVGENRIAADFYRDINMSQIGDFFVSLQSNYNRDWSEAEFKVEPNKYVFEE